VIIGAGPAVLGYASIFDNSQIMSDKVYKSTYEPIPLPRQNIWHFLYQDNPNQEPSKPAYVDVVTGRSITFGELPRLTKRLAHGLVHKAGLKRGDTLLVFSPNHVLYPAIVHSSAAAAVTLTAANSAYTPSELSV
jgi:4-coumarate--CoA ligase